MDHFLPMMLKLQVEQVFPIRCWYNGLALIIGEKDLTPVKQLPNLLTFPQKMVWALIVKLLMDFYSMYFLRRSNSVRATAENFGLELSYWRKKKRIS